MRLRSGFKMRMSILSTATTEQMGYGMVSFFVCFLQTNEIVNYSFSIPRDIYFSDYCLRVFQILMDVLPP